MKLKAGNTEEFDPVAAVAERPTRLKQKKLDFGTRLAAATLRESGMHPVDVANTLGIHERTVRRIEDEECLDPSTVAKSKKIIAGKFQLLTEMVLGAITPEKLSAMSAYQLVGMAGILHQNARLADGLSTQNLAVRSVATNLNADLVALREMKQKLLASLPQGGTVGDRQNEQG